MSSTAARPATWTTAWTIAGLLFAFSLVAERVSARSNDDLGPAGLQAAPEIPDAGSWTTQTVFPLTGVVRSWGAFFPDNGKFYVLGGRESDLAASEILNPREYSPLGLTWATKAAAFADGQVNNMVGGVLDFGGTDYIVVVGGSAAVATTTSEVRQYDPIADTMTTLTLDPWPGNVGGATLPGGGAVYANKLYVLGGYHIGVGMVATIWKFDPALTAGNRWSQMTAALPTALGYIPTAISGAGIYTLGGSDFLAGVPTDTTLAFRFDPAGDSIASVAAAPRAVGETRAVTQIDGKIWVLGGGRQAPNPSAQVDIYDPVLNSWSLGPPMLTARRNFPADVDPGTGEILAVGGYAPTAVSSVNEKYSALIFNDSFELGDLSAWSTSFP